MKKYSKKEIVIIITFILFVLVSIIGITFAWFSAQVEGNDTASTMTVQMANLKLEFTDTNLIEGDKILPGWTRTKTFTVENLGDVAVNYDIDIIDVASTFEGQDLVYEITSTNNGGTKTEIVLPNTNDTLIVNAVIEPLTTQTYTIKITFKETGEDQNIDQGKSYRGKLQITPRISSVAIAGYALDAQGNAIPNRVVELHSDPVSTTTDSSGYYEFRNVPVGEHTIILKNSTNTAEEASKTITLASGSETKYTNNTLILENTVKKYIVIQLTGNTIDLKVESAEVILGESSGTVYIGKPKEVEINGEGYGTLSCMSSDSSKATCSIEGTTLTITGVSSGTGTITVSESKLNASGTYNYEVKESSISLSEDSGTIAVGATKRVNITGTDMGQLYCGTTSDLIATCDIEDNTLIVTTVAAGTATITVREGNGDKTDTFSITGINFLQTYNYTSAAPQTFTVPASGNYQVELWGAQGGGGTDTCAGKYAAYTKGTIYLDQGEVLYLYIGSTGSGRTGGYNGGGTGVFITSGSSTWNYYGAGGATDIRCFYNSTTKKCETNTDNLIWNDNLGLNSRIMVVAGGGGLNYHSYYGCAGASFSAGGLYGYSSQYYANSSATQFRGGAYGTSTQLSGTIRYSIAAGFGYGTPQGTTYSSGSLAMYMAGSGGYYGGAGVVDNNLSGAGTGSCFISGHTGSVAIANASLVNDPRTTRTDSNGVLCSSSSSTGYNANGYNVDSKCSEHYSGKKFTDTLMIDGTGKKWIVTDGVLSTPSQVMPNPAGGTYTAGIGRSGAGVARITLLPN